MDFRELRQTRRQNFRYPLRKRSSRIAAYEAGLDFTGYEIDKYYYDLQENRFREFLEKQAQEIGENSAQ